MQQFEEALRDRVLEQESRLSRIPEGLTPLGRDLQAAMELSNVSRWRQTRGDEQIAQDTRALGECAGGQKVRVEVVFQAES